MPLVFSSFVGFFLGLLILQAQKPAPPSIPFIPWQEGNLDIYHFALGTGVSAFAILPDGTTFLIDAGELFRERPAAYDSPQLPDISRRAGEWIEAWIRAFHPEGEAGHVDYAMISHFHGDHFGTITPKSPSSRKPGAAYRLSGITDVFDRLSLGTLIDRHGLQEDTPSLPDNQDFSNYLDFRNYLMTHHDLEVAAAVVGGCDQVRLVNNCSAYSNFKVCVIAANGSVWHSRSSKPRSHYPAKSEPNENAFSISLRIDYGPFSYFTAGDLPGLLSSDQPTWMDMESAVAWEVGPVDVNVVNHHGFRDSANPYFLSVLKPQVHILTPYAASHPSPEVWDRLMSRLHYPGDRFVFSTLGMWPGRFSHMVSLFGEEGAATVRNHLTEGPSNGHILVRVDPGGEEFEVLVLKLDPDPNHREVSYQARFPSRAGH